LSDDKVNTLKASLCYGTENSVCQVKNTRLLLFIFILNGWYFYQLFISKKLKKMKISWSPINGYSLGGSCQRQNVCKSADVCLTNDASTTGTLCCTDKFCNNPSQFTFSSSYNSHITSSSSSSIRFLMSLSLLGLIISLLI
jgi:hypothetical protein